MAEPKRRARADRAHIAEGEFRNVTFRCGAAAYNRLVDAAAKAGTSISAVCEGFAVGASTQADLRSLIREELRSELRAELRSELRLAMAECVLDDDDTEGDEARH